MTTAEAAKELGISLPHVLYLARKARLKLKKIKIKAPCIGYWRIDLAPADVEILRAKRRQLQVAHSERSAKRMKRLAKDPKITRIRIAARDPEEWRRTQKKAVKAAAERRRQLREWLWRHDTV
jgi:hypothetical protein